MTPWQVEISTFKHIKDNEPVRKRLTGPEYFSDFRVVTVAERTDEGNTLAEKRGKDGPLFSPVTYHPGVPRGADFVEQVTMMVFDWDNKPNKPEIERSRIDPVRKVLQDWDIEYALYTTFKHTPDLPSFRTVHPLVAPFSPEHYNKVWDHFNAFFRSKGIAPDPKCRGVAHVYYTPSTRILEGDKLLDYQFSEYWPSPEGAYDTTFITGTRVFNVGVPKKSLKPTPSDPQALPPVFAKLAAHGAARKTQEKKEAAVSAELFEGIEKELEVEDYSRIVAQCAFIEYATDNAAQLGEWEWYAQLSVAARCKEGKELVQVLSEGHPGYEPFETEKKRQHTLKDMSGPFTCAKIAQQSAKGAQVCPTCPHWGKITSPVQLGRPDPTTATPEELREDAKTRAEANTLKATRLVAEAKARRGAAERVESLAKTNLKNKKGLVATAEQIADLEKQVQDAKDAVKAAKKQEKQAEADEKAAFKALADAERYSDANPTTQASLLTDNSGGLATKWLSNAQAVFETDPAYKNIWYDEFSERVRQDDDEVSQVRVSRIRSDLQKRYGLDPLKSDVTEALLLVSDGRKKHPVRDYLRGLTWRGESLLKDLFSKGFGAVAPEDIENGAEFLQIAGIKFAISAVSRVLEERRRPGMEPDGGPGGQVDTVFILAGDQGVRKTSAFRIIAKNKRWFSNSSVDLRSKDSYQQMEGIWIYEFGELDSLKKAEQSHIKNFITSREDNYRPPYAATTKTRPRQTIIVGTTNESEFLADPTGDRRFVPIPVGACNLKWLRDNVDQLWAEAVSLYDQGAEWWFTKEEEAQRSAIADTYREEPLMLERIWTFLCTSKTVRSQGYVTIAQICSEMLMLPDSSLVERKFKLHISDCLRCLGLTKSKHMVNGRKQKVFPVPPELFPSPEKNPEMLAGFNARNLTAQS